MAPQWQSPVVSLPLHHNGLDEAFWHFTMAWLVHSMPVLKSVWLVGDPMQSPIAHCKELATFEQSASVSHQNAMPLT
eukprot:1263769-Amphidinium_carterae.1